MNSATFVLFENREISRKNLRGERWMIPYPDHLSFTYKTKT